MVMGNNPSLGRAAGARAHRVGPESPTPEVDSTVPLASPEIQREGVLQVSRAPPFLCSAPRAGMIQHCRAFLGDDSDVYGVVERWRARLVTLRAQAYSRMHVEFDYAILLLQGLFAQRA
jgi:hypothetical protein